MTELSQMKMDSLAYSSMNQLEAVEARKFKHFRQILLFILLLKHTRMTLKRLDAILLNIMTNSQQYSSNPFSDQG